MTKAKSFKRKFEIIDFDPKTKAVEMTSTYTTKNPLNDKQLDELIKRKMAEPYHKNSVWRILR